MKSILSLWMLSLVLCCTDGAKENELQEASGYVRLFGSKTRYRDQTNNKEVFRIGLDEPTSCQQQQHQQQFQLVQVQQVNRHGTRFPTKGNIKSIEQLIQKLQSQYSDFIPQWLRSYQLPYNVSVQGQLAATGVSEHAQFGNRTRHVMRQLKPLAFSPERFALSHTYVPRTKDSATAFASGFFDNAEQVKYTENPKENDVLLRFFDECPRYQRDVLNSSETSIQAKQYKNSSVMQTNVETLKQKLGISENGSVAGNLTIGDVSTVFSACAFDLALYDQKDHWCTLLTKPMLQSLEYADDLKTFYHKGNGFKLNYEIAAVLLRDVFTFMSDFIAGKHNTVGNFRFAHAETTIPLLALMGVTQSEPKLEANWTMAQINSRQYRTSEISPFATHVEFRLYQQLHQPKQQSDGSGYVVQIVVNEKPVTIKGCSHSKYCGLQELQTLWRYYLEEFNFEQYCAL